jgi:hypothetical protein
MELQEAIRQPLEYILKVNESEKVMRYDNTFKQEENIMVCTYTRNYTYQPNTMNKSIMDIVCDAIIDYVETYGENHGIRITISNAKKQYNIAIGHNNRRRG